MKNYTPPITTYYEVLGLQDIFPHNVTQRDIRTHFIERAKSLQQMNLFGDTEEERVRAGNDMVLLITAYKTLRDPDQKNEHDINLLDPWRRASRKMLNIHTPGDFKRYEQFRHIVHTILEHERFGCISGKDFKNFLAGYMNEYMEVLGNVHDWRARKTAARKNDLIDKLWGNAISGGDIATQILIRRPDLVACPATKEAAFFDLRENIGSDLPEFLRDAHPEIFTTEELGRLYKDIAKKLKPLDKSQIRQLHNRRYLMRATSLADVLKRSTAREDNNIKQCGASPPTPSFDHTAAKGDTKNFTCPH